MPIPTAILTLVLGMILVLAGLWIGQGVNMLPVEASVNAPVYDELFKVLFSIGTILFILVAGLLLFSLVKFRRPAGDLEDGIPLEGNLPLEIFWTAIPAVVVLFVGLYSYNIFDRMGGMVDLNDHGAMHAGMHQAKASQGQAGSTLLAVAGGGSEGQSEPGNPSHVWGGIGIPGDGLGILPVEVTAMQFAFIFRYPERNIISGELHVPTGMPVELRMEAKDVIHAFWVPQFRLKQDVIPGQPTVLSFTATRPGTYPIVCAELCGPYHGGMRSSVVVHEPEAYDKWLQDNTPATTT